MPVNWIGTVSIDMVIELVNKLLVPSKNATVTVGEEGVEGVPITCKTSGWVDLNDTPTPDTKIMREFVVRSTVLASLRLRVYRNCVSCHIPVFPRGERNVSEKPVDPG